MLNFAPQSELEVIKRDAYSSDGKTFAERTAMFLDIMKMVDAMQSHLSPEERERRSRVADQIDPRPDPWWRNFRKEALAEYQCRTSLM
jgi:hypothetical protein